MERHSRYLFFFPAAKLVASFCARRSRGVHYLFLLQDSD
jgi:hypothetical protein